VAKSLIIIFTLFLVFSPTNFLAQSPDETQIIKVKKESTYVKAAFDETEYKVIAFDKYGNPHQNAIKSFTIFYKENTSAFENHIVGNLFNETAIKFFTKKKKTATKICITKIIAENADGHLEELPDLCDIVIFPDCKKVKH